MSNNNKKGSQKLRQRHPFFTLLLVPHEPGQRTTHWHISRNFVYFLLFLGAFLTVVFAGAIWYSSHLTFKLAGYWRVFEENKIQQAGLKDLSKQNLEMTEKVNQLIQDEEEINKTLGRKSSLNLIDSPSTGIRLSHLLPKPAPKDLATVKKKFSELNRTLADLEQRQSMLLAEVKGYAVRFAHTPSIWPASGRISSSFGYRSSLGGSGGSYHPAIDIATSYGAPVRATAEGTVNLASWYGGYGLAVKINHDNGLTTLYGHNSQLLVRAGSLVKKGQVIAYAGASGFATGPHVHYEMASWDRQIDPSPYLDLDMISAIRKWLNG